MRHQALSFFCLGFVSPTTQMEGKRGSIADLRGIQGTRLRKMVCPVCYISRTNTQIPFLQPRTQLSHQNDTTNYVMNSRTSRNTTSSRTLQMGTTQPMKASPKKLLIPRKIPLRQQRRRHGHPRYEKRHLFTSTSTQLYLKSRMRSGFTSNLRATSVGISIIAPNTLFLPFMMPSKRGMA
jgi:hypothetical protein